MNSDNCLIWPGSTATLRDGSNSVICDSPRAGGCYQLTRPLPTLDDDEKARLTTLTIDLRNQSGDRCPIVTPELIESARRTSPLPVDERADRLLRFIGYQSRRIGDTVTLTDRGDSGTSHEFAGAMAWSESTERSEVTFLRDYLVRHGWLDKISSYQYWVTVDGHRRIADVKTNADSTQAFVAMWFDEGMEAAYRQGIVPAIDSAGYRPMRIDQKPDVNKIDDEIIAEIRRSRFLVADFTQGEDGARGGVYFEAGFALGLGIPVIYTCRENAIDKIHFDTRQYHHTAWRDPEDLRDKLTKRILARIGEGTWSLLQSQAR